MVGEFSVTMDGRLPRRNTHDVTRLACYIMHVTPALDHRVGKQHLSVDLGVTNSHHSLLKDEVW
jgi:hypothetical protein